MKAWKLLILSGILLVVFGLLLLLFEKWKFRLPGDIYIRRGNFEFYFPIATSILISILLTIILNLIFRK